MNKYEEFTTEGRAYLRCSPLI